MTRLITVEEIASKLDLGKKPDHDKINPIIDKAQDVELRDYLGMHFYFDVISNIDNPNYQNLLSGSTFFVEDIQYQHEGLKSMLMDLVYSRLILEINVNVTPFGATIKHSSDSEPASQLALKDIAHQNREGAASKWEIIKLYLESSNDAFPNYNYKANTLKTGERKLKFWRIR